MIEELEAELREARMQLLLLRGLVRGAYEAQLVAEAKLAKAINALEKVQGFVKDLEPYADQGHTLVPALREACEVLVVLKGEKDD